MIATRIRNYYVIPVTFLTQADLFRPIYLSADRISNRDSAVFFYFERDGALRGVPAEGVADKQQSVATCLGARGKPSPFNTKFDYA